MNKADTVLRTLVVLFLASGTYKEQVELLNEISLMKRIGKHPHIVSITGCITADNPVCLVVEFCSGGDLLTCIRNSHFYVRWVFGFYLYLLFHSIFL